MKAVNLKISYVYYHYHYWIPNRIIPDNNFLIPDEISRIAIVHNKYINRNRNNILIYFTIIHVLFPTSQTSLFIQTHLKIKRSRMLECLLSQRPNRRSTWMQPRRDVSDNKSFLSLLNKSYHEKETKCHMCRFKENNMKRLRWKGQIH